MTLNHRITLLQRPVTSDALGESQGEWQDLAPVWADVRYLSGVETLRAGGEVSIAKASIRIRARAGLSAQLRVRYGAAVLDVGAVLPDAADSRYVFLACEQVEQP